ncbi:MAG: phytoene desaturase family protein [Actinomycetota bacterium]|nr:phytoene desaturase family protein [Actinomycetota bacterium]
MRVVVAGAGVGGLAAAVRLAAAGHEVTVCERGEAPGGKAGRLELDGGFRFDTGPSLLTMPWVLRDLFAATGAPLEEELELVRVEPVTRYRFADGTGFDLSADLPRAMEALEAWSPGAGADWARFLGTCAGMWRAGETFLAGPPPWPPRRPRPGQPRLEPLDLVRARPWETLRALARGHARDPRLRLVIERFATYAGGDPRRSPAALAVAGYVEHAFGAWHVRGGLYAIVEALARRLGERGGTLRAGTAVTGIERAGRRVVAAQTTAGRLPADLVVWNGDALALARVLGRRPGPRGRAPERSVSGFALMLALRSRSPATVHHEIRFPARYDAEFDDLFAAGRLVRDPTLYLSTSSVTDPGEAPADGENLFVLVNAPARPFAPEELDRYERTLIDRVGVRDRLVASARRTPADLERETGAVAGAIYGAAPHGRLASLRRPGPVVPGVRGLLRVGGTGHPGGGLPLVVLGAKMVADLAGPA